MGRISGSANAEIDRPLEEVWALVEDVLVAPEWQGGLDSMEAIETDDQGRATLVESATDAKVTKIKTKVRFSYDGAPNVLTWTQVKGDLKSVDGRWELEDLGEGRTRATYALEVDTGTVLGMLIRGPIEGRLRDMLVKSRPGELKAHLEG